MNWLRPGGLNASREAAVRPIRYTGRASRDRRDRPLSRHAHGRRILEAKGVLSLQMIG